MAFKLRTRAWLDAASETALVDLRGEVARLAGEVGALRSCVDEQKARQQQEVETLRNDLRALADRFESHADRIYATADDVSELQRGMGGRDAKIEDVRLGLVGLTEQLRWDSNDLRKSLTAIIERVERQRIQI